MNAKFSLMKRLVEGRYALKKWQVFNVTLFKGLYLKDDKNSLKILSIIKRHIFLDYITLAVAKARRKITNYFLSDVKKYSLEVFGYFSSTTLRSASPSMYPRLS